MNREFELRDLYNFDRRLPDVVKTYLEGSLTNETNYNAMKSVLDALVASKSGARAVVTLADGTLVYDSKNNSLSTTDPSVSTKLNKAVNANNKGIGENHQSRIAIMLACLTVNGVGMEQKYSTSTGKFEEYLAVRVGPSSRYAIGVIRVSLS